MDISILSKMELKATVKEPEMLNLKNFSARKFKEKDRVIVHFKIFDKKLNNMFFEKLRLALQKSHIALVDPDGMFGIDYPIYAIVTDSMEKLSIDDTLQLLDQNVRQS